MRYTAMVPTNPAPRTGPTLENLPLFYQGVLTAVVRLQGGRMRLDDPPQFRKMMQNLFQEVSKEAMNVGYTAEEIEDANCITAAFVDETVGKLLARQQPWTPLFSTMFSRTDAGEAVFQRLLSIQSRPPSAHQRDLLEIYYLCFLLGYEGRFAGWRNEIEQYKEQLRSQIDSLRPIDPRLSPLANLPASTAAGAAPVAPIMAAPKQSSSWLAISAGCLAVAGVSWVAAKALLNSEWHGVLGGLLRP